MDLYWKYIGYETKETRRCLRGAWQRRAGYPCSDFTVAAFFLWENYGIVYWNTGSIIITLKTNTKKYGSFVKAYLEKEKAKLRGKNLKGKKYYHKVEIILI